MSDQNNSQHGFFLLIPAFIADDKDLDDSTKILFGRLAALSNNKGYCWASDKYLAELSGCADRVISDRLLSLEKKGYIIRETVKSGFSWDRKIYPIFNIQNNFTKRTPVPFESARPCPSKAHARAEEQYKHNNISKQQQGAPPNAAAVVDFSSVDKKQQAPPKKVEPPQKPKIYDFLEAVDIPQEDKIEITSRYDYKTVKDALDFSLENKNLIKTTFIQYFKMSCQKGLKIEIKAKDLTPYEKACKYFKDGEVYNQALCILKRDHIAFERGMRNDHIKLDKYFTINRLSELCASFGIKIDFKE